MRERTSSHAEVQEAATRGRRTDRTVWVAHHVNNVFWKLRLIRPKWVNQNREAIAAFIGQEQVSKLREFEGFCGAKCAY